MSWYIVNKLPSGRTPLLFYAGRIPDDVVMTKKMETARVYETREEAAASVRKLCENFEGSIFHLYEAI